MVIFEKITVKSIAVSKIVITFAIEFRTRGVAQLVSAPRSGRGGRKFESSHPDQLELKMPMYGVLSSFFYPLRWIMLKIGGRVAMTVELFKSTTGSGHRALCEGCEKAGWPCSVQRSEGCAFRMSVISRGCLRFALHAVSSKMGLGSRGNEIFLFQYRSSYRLFANFVCV